MNLKGEGYNVKLNVEGTKNLIDEKHAQFKKEMAGEGPFGEADDAFLMFEMSKLVHKLPELESKDQVAGPIILLLDDQSNGMHLTLLYINRVKVTDDEGNDFDIKNSGESVDSITNDFILSVLKDNVEDTTIAIAVVTPLEYIAGKFKRDSIPDHIKSKQDFIDYAKANATESHGMLGHFQARHDPNNRPPVINIMFTKIVGDGNKKERYTPNHQMSRDITIDKYGRTPKGMLIESDSTKPGVYFLDFFKEIELIDDDSIEVIDNRKPTKKRSSDISFDILKNEILKRKN